MVIADQKQEDFDLVADSTNQEASIEDHDACVDWLEEGQGTGQGEIGHHEMSEYFLVVEDYPLEGGFLGCFDFYFFLSSSQDTTTGLRLSS